MKDSDEQSLRIEGEAAFRAMANPLRRKALAALAAESLDARGLASKLGVGTTALYRHLELLLDAGLIEVDEVRKVRGLDSKRYRAKPIPVSEAGDLAIAPEGLQRLGAAQANLRVSESDVHTLLQHLMERAVQAHHDSGEDVVLTISIDRDLTGQPRD